MDPALLLRQGKDLDMQGRDAEALALYRQAAEGFREIDNLDGQMLAGCYVVQSLRVLHRLDEAEQEARSGAALAKDETAPLDPLTRCNAFRSLGEVLRVRGKYEEAEGWLEKAARLAEDETAPLDPLTRCNAFRSLGNVLSVRGKDEEAEGWLEKAARLAVDETAPLDPLTRCNAFESLGNVLGVQGKYDEAQGWLEEAARLAEDETAPLDPLTRCNAFMLLGNVLGVRGKYDKAEGWLEKAARLAEDETAPLDPLTRCNAFMLLGEVLSVRGKDEEAEGWLDKAARLAEDETAPLNPLTRCNAFRSLGNVLSVRGKDEEAEGWLEKAARLAEDETAPLDPLTRCNAFMLLGEVLSVRGKYEEAEGWLDKAARLAEDETAPLNPLTRCNAFRSLGNVLGVRGKDEEAEGWLEKAARLAEDETAPLDPLARLNVNRSLGTLLAKQRRWKESLERLTRAREALAEILGSNRWPDAMDNYLARYGDLFELGWRVSTLVWRQTGDRAYLRQMLDFLDGRKCVAIREGLRRQSNRQAGWDGAELTWEYGPSNWPFHDYDPSSASLNSRAAIRGNATADEAGVDDFRFEFPGGEIDPSKNGFSQPVTTSELAELLPAKDNLLLAYNVDDDDLIVLPIVRDAETGEPRILHGKEDLIRIEGARPKLEELVGKHHDKLQRLLHGRNPSTKKLNILDTAEQLHNRGYGLREGISSELYELLGFEQVFSLLEQNPAELHVTLFPDGPLFGLPLHAAYSKDRKSYVYEQVASINYGLSLKTLYLQHKIEADARDRETVQTELQGTVFANPERHDDDKAILHSIGEASNLKDVMGETHWRFHGEISPDEALIPHMNQWHGLGNLLWTIGHGGPMTSTIKTADGRPVEVIRPSVELCDGPLSTEQMALGGYDFQNVWLVHFSCCLLGQLSESQRTKQIEGFISGLTLLGARRVTSAMWELLDKAAAEFARHWMAALNRHVFTPNRQPHAFAIALKEALTAFRHADNGRYDHEVFWAPYTMYGPG